MASTQNETPLQENILLTRLKPKQKNAQIEAENEGNEMQSPVARRSGVEDAAGNERHRSGAKLVGGRKRGSEDWRCAQQTLGRVYERPHQNPTSSILRNLHHGYISDHD
jgi:hypothetical protein